MSGNEPEFGDVTTPAPEPDRQIAAAEVQAELPPAAQRFQSCRWRKAAENGTPDHCTHRDVQPIAGTAGFSAESWCLDCGHYKVRRNPRKRPLPAPEGRYYY